MPKLSMPGAVIVGDAGGMVDTVALKGVHHCIKAGKLAAEAIYANLKAGESLERYETAIANSSVGKELWQVRNTRQPFQKGFLRGGPSVNLGLITRGLLPAGRLKWHRNDEQEMFIGDTSKSYPKPDGKYIFDKLSSVPTACSAGRSPPRADG
jgi:electron-transferring-flavoprotein dehydrogenase